MKCISFNSYINLKDCVESILFNSGEILADATFESDNKERVTVSLETRGDFKVEYKGELYERADEFPIELKELIKKEFWWDTDENVYVYYNNWFEYIVRTDKSENGIMCEGDLTKYSLEDLKKEMADIAEYF